MRARSKSVRLWADNVICAQRGGGVRFSPHFYTPRQQLEKAVAAVQAAGLADTLKGDGPFTLFAPTNDAFAKLPAGTVDSLLKPENKDQLVAVLTYHVIPGAVTSDQIAGQRLDVATVQGSTIHVDARSGVRVNKAHVTQADIMASNGVIHRIDTVLLPPSK